MRLIDLHCNWSLQYARESSHYDPTLYPEVASRLGQVDGYLTSVSAVVLSCGRRTEDWARQRSPCQALGEMIARYEAEFPGRLLRGPEDLARWEDEPEGGLCWGILAVDSLDFLVRSPDDLERLPWLLTRGVRVVRLAASGDGVLAGFDAPGNDRGLSDLGRAVIGGLADLVAPSNPVALDVAGLNVPSTRDVLSWYEADPGRLARLLLVRSHGTIESAERPGAGGLDPENLRRFRGLGGTLGLSVGVPFVSSPSMLRGQIEAAASMPFGEQPGHHGIAIGTDFLGLDEVVPGLENAPRVLEWLGREFPPPVTAVLTQGSAREFLRRLLAR